MQRLGLGCLATQLTYKSNIPIISLHFRTPTNPDLSATFLPRAQLFSHAPPSHTVRPIMTSSMASRLQGKTIVITGASSGIGRSTAFEFARTSSKDLRLVLTARRIDTLQQIAADIKKEVGDGVKVLPVKLDVNNADEVRDFVDKLPEDFRQIDCLINNA